MKYKYEPTAMQDLTYSNVLESLQFELLCVTGNREEYKNFLKRMAYDFAKLNQSRRDLSAVVMDACEKLKALGRKDLADEALGRLTNRAGRFEELARELNWGHDE